jgi:hypothetical protein
MSRYQRAVHLANEVEKVTLPMSPVEREDLEREAGHQFISDEEAHRYRLRKLKNALIEELLTN